MKFIKNITVVTNLSEECVDILAEAGFINENNDGDHAGSQGGRGGRFTVKPVPVTPSVVAPHVAEPVPVMLPTVGVEDRTENRYTLKFLGKSTRDI